MRIGHGRRGRTLLVGLASVAALSGTAVGVGLSSTADAARAATHTLPPTVRLTVQEPRQNEVVTGSTLAIRLESHGYRINSQYAGTPDSSLIGHYHEILDGNLVDMSPYIDGTEDTVPMVGVSDGPHVLTLVPANNDHSTVANAAVNIPFIYAGPYLSEPAGYTGTGAPGVSITAPRNGSAVGGRFFTMNITASNFVLCGECFGKSLVAGEGHWHIFADQVDMAHMLTMGQGDGTTGSQQVALAGLTPGWHTFYAVLVDNHHMPIMPMTMASERLYVQPGEH